MRTSQVVLVVSAVSLLAACAGQVPAPRKPIAHVPPADPQVSRVLIAPGMLDRGGAQSATLATTRQVGPVYFDGKYVGDLEQNEYIVVDVAPGTHSVACSPLEPVRNYIEPRQVNFAPGETKELVCEMATGGVKGNFASRSYLEQREIDLRDSAVVGYSKVP